MSGTISSRSRRSLKHQCVARPIRSSSSSNRTPTLQYRRSGDGWMLTLREVSRQAAAFNRAMRTIRHRKCIGTIERTSALRLPDTKNILCRGPIEMWAGVRCYDPLQATGQLADRRLGWIVEFKYSRPSSGTSAATLVMSPSNFPQWSSSTTMAFFVPAMPPSQAAMAPIASDKNPAIAAVDRVVAATSAARAACCFASSTAAR